MKKRYLLFAVICTLILTLFSACDLKNAGPLKSITSPYIAQYECVDAKLGEDDLLEKFEYIKITLVNKDNLELCYKPKKGERKTLKSKYNFNPKTHELSAEMGILGYTFKQSTIVEKGKFTISKQIGGKQLVMNFKAS